MSKRRFFVNSDCIAGDKAYILGEERNHLVNVLRLKVSDEVILVISDGFDYHAIISQINKNSVEFDITMKCKNEMESEKRVALFQGVAKGEKLDFLVQKATELGAKEFVPFTSEFSAVKESKVRVERLDKISREAVKQCQRSDVLKISSAVTFLEMTELLKGYDVVVFAYEKEDKLKIKDISEKLLSASSIALVVGCEGGFSEREASVLRELENVRAISLGRRILRLETAGVTLLSIVMHESAEL